MRIVYYGQILLFLLIYSFSSSQTLSNKKATIETKKLYSYLSNLDSKILSGQHNYNEEPSKYTDIVEKMTGKTPAVWGTDLYWNRKENPQSRIVKAALKKHQEGAIITLMWHVGRPFDNSPYSWKNSVQNSINEKDWKAILTPGTRINEQWKAQVDTVAKALLQLQEKNIPVLWRPYHEMNGVWFWWGNKPGKDGYIALWKMLYHRLTDYHHLNNLIWVWNANAPRDIPDDEAFPYQDFYPGADYVDILATDVYHYDYEQNEYNELLKLANGKPIALGEVGELPKETILEKQPKWSWFMVWANWVETANTPKRVQNIYKAENTLDLSNLPSF